MTGAFDHGASLNLNLAQWACVLMIGHPIPESIKNGIVQVDLWTSCDTKTVSVADVHGAGFDG